MSAKIKESLEESLTYLFEELHKKETHPPK
jgi:hypothetical protein